MREILFRGKTIRTESEWVYGFYNHIPCGRFLCEEHCIQTIKDDGKIGQLYIVYEGTVGQFIGLTDKNGVKIFEGDIIRAKIEGGNNHNGFTWKNMPVGFQEGAFCLNNKNGSVFCVLGAFAPSVTLEVIGNIHDNPELLEGS